MPGERAMVVTHPHPLYGGDMHNHVVKAVVSAYGAQGFTTLRFNFRGVGESQGSYDGGAGERIDVLAAIRHLEDMDKKIIHLAGYSFGAWVNALGIEDYADRITNLVFVSPPVDFLDFSFLKSCRQLRLVITGSRDEIASPKSIRELLPQWNCDAVLRIISGTDHFYLGKTDRLEAAIREFILGRKTPDSFDGA
jgi:alpha/beta superfamily hydrolase